MNLILRFDFGILEFLDFVRCDFLNPFMKFITSLGNAGMFWIVLGVLLFCTKKYREEGFSVLLSLVINLVLVNIIVKPNVARIRPFDLVEGVKLIIEAPKDFSFPSGHTSASFASALALFYHNKKWGIWAFALAILIGFSRLYLYVHYPTDVVAGALFGIISAMLAHGIIKNYKVKYNEKRA